MFGINICLCNAYKEEIKYPGRLSSASKIKGVCQGYCMNQWKLGASFPFVTTGNFYQRQFGSVPIIIKIPSIFLATEEP